MSKPNIEVILIECMGTQYVEVRTLGETKLVLFESQAFELFWGLTQVLHVLSKKGKEG